MRFIETPLPGVFVIEPELKTDERGFFARIGCERELREAGLEGGVKQCSLSSNTKKGTLRGMHFQTPPHAETKIIACTAGALFDVVVDLRPDSPAFCGWYGVELSRANRKMIYIPAGCAHGYQTLEDGTDILYQINAFHVPECSAGVRWDDPAFGIAWPTADNRIISEKDNSWPHFTPHPALSPQAGRGVGERGKGKTHAALS